MTITLLGETHGTKETPEIAKQYFKDANTICMEIPSDQQEYVDKNQLDNAPFFNRPAEQAEVCS